MSFSNPNVLRKSSSVGAEGRNVPADVAKVETLLDGLGAQALRQNRRAAG